jgi:hypothetical protein
MQPGIRCAQPQPPAPAIGHEHCRGPASGSDGLHCSWFRIQKSLTFRCESVCCEIAFWRSIMRTVMSGWLLACLVSAVGGCQSWSQVPGGSRVPPPGTGTYPVQTNYYNSGARTGAVSSNTNPAGSAASTTPARTASQPLPSTTTTGATTASWQPPTVDQMRTGINNTASAVFEDVGSKANQVVQAGTTRAAAAAEKYTAPVQQPANAPASRSLSDSETSQDPQLDWQPPR